MLLSIHLTAAPVCLAQTKKPATAPSEMALRARLEMNPQDKTSHKQLIDLLKKRNAFRAIANEDSSWLQHNPDEYVVLLELISYAKAALHDPEFAIEAEETYLKNSHREDDPYYYDAAADLLANDLAARGQFDKSIEILNNIIQENPDEAGFLVDKASILTSAGRQTEAIAIFRQSIGMDANQESTHTELAKALLKGGDLAGAESEYRAALSLYKAELDAPTDSMHTLVQSLNKVEKKFQSDHYLADVHEHLALVLMREGKYEQAIRETQAVLDADKDELSAYYLRAEIYDAEGNGQSAKESRQQADKAIASIAEAEIKKDPSSFGDPRILFLSQGLLDSQSDSVKFSGEVIKLLVDRTSPPLTSMEHVILAEAYYDVSRVSEAKEQWDTALRLDAKLNNPVYQYQVGYALLEAHRSGDALSHLQVAYEMDPQNRTYRIDYEKAQSK